MSKRVVIIGAAGRDFHNFNVVYRDNPEYDVVAFTATQIPNIDGRVYPPELAGALYPDGIPIVSEDDLETVIRDMDVDLAVFSYSDVAHADVMRVGARVLAAGAGFLLLSPHETYIKSSVPVIAVCAIRTGAGKSQTSRKIASILAERGKKVVVIRHPMPYGDLAKQAVQRFETLDDLDLHDTTIEEREEYEPHINAGRIVYAGVDYGAILAAAEKEADVIIWDGGNNDVSFYDPDLLIVVLDPHRAGHATRFHPSGVNARLADVFVINKVDTATGEQVEEVRKVAVQLNESATIIEAASPLTVEDETQIRGKRVLVIEDGPTLTHGGMAFGAGWVAAKQFGAAEIIDPRPHAVGSIRKTYDKYPSTGDVLPAMGYGDEQIAELEQTIRNVAADLVLIATPIDLRRVLTIDQPSLRVRYDLQEIGEPNLEMVLNGFLNEIENATV